MSLTNEQINNNTILISINEDRLDSASAPTFKQYFLDTVNENCQKVVLDLSNVLFMDSSGLGVLISSLKHLNSQGSIILIGIQANVQALMTLTRMDRLFPQYESLEQALSLEVN